MKIILIVREPVSRLQSEITHCLVRQRTRHLKRKCHGLNAYFEDIFKSNTTHLLKQNKFIRNSLYYLDIKQWLNYLDLSSDQLIVIDGESFIKQPWAELNRCEQFLNVTRFIKAEHFHFDANKKFFCLNTDIAENTNTSYGCLGKNKGRERQIYLSDFVKKSLRGYFQEWNELFFKEIGQTFKW